MKYENRFYNNWRIIYRVDSERSIAKCTLCNQIYNVRTSDVINGKSRKCVSCANAGHTKIVEGVLLGDWKVLERYNYKSVKVKCVLCGFERIIRPDTASKYLCGCKRGLVCNGITFDKVKDLYNYLQPKLKT